MTTATTSVLPPPRKLLLALEAVLYIAYHSRAQPVSNKALSNQLAFPARHLEHDMQKLAQANILRGVRGPNGGYVLARERRNISLADICQALSNQDDGDEPFAFASDYGHKIISPAWEKAMHQLAEDLSHVTLEQLCEQTQAAGVAGKDDDVEMYSI